jgi:hypothetical protein
MLARWLVIIGVVLAGPALAIDEDFYIPYTDTYGYVYDPATGKFVKQEPANTAAAAADSSVSGPHSQDPGMQEQLSQNAADQPGSTEQNITMYLVIGGVIILAAVSYLLLQRKKNASA